MKRAVCTGLTALLLGAGAAGCERSEPSVWDDVPAAVECGITLQDAVEIDSDEGELQASVACSGSEACTPDEPLLVGTWIEVGLTVPKPTGDRLVFLTDDVMAPGTPSDGNFELQRDPCTGDAVFQDGWQLAQPGELPLIVSVGRDGDTTELDRFTFEARAPESAQVELQSADGEWRAVTALELAVGESAQLRVVPLGADGERINPNGQGRFWIEDAALADLAGEGLPRARGEIAGLDARAAGSSTLHALVANVELELPVTIAE